MTLTNKQYLSINTIFRNDEKYKDVLQFIRTGEIPKHIKYKTRFKNTFEQYTQKLGVLYFDDIPIAKNEDIETILKKLYDNPVNSLATGITNFYKFVRTKYLNITRDDVNKFLKTQQIFQTTRPTLTKRMNKPILATYPNQMWGIDLIDLGNHFKNAFGQVKYILNIVDVFSRKVFLFPLNNKLSSNIADCFKVIKKRIKILPKYILCDNGGEFMHEFQEYCKEQGITIRKTRAYSPQSNGIVERKNKEIRRKINEMMIRNDNERFRWSPLLKIVEDNINSSYTDSINGSPNDVWAPTIDKINLNDAQNELVENTIRKTKDKMETFKDKELNIGDLVRCKMSSLFLGVQHKIKSNETKHIPITYSPDVYRIYKKIIPKKLGFTKSSFLLETLDGHKLVIGKNDTPKRFYMNELQFTPDNFENENIDMETALKLDDVVFDEKQDVHYGRKNK